MSTFWKQEEQNRHRVLRFFFNIHIFIHIYCSNSVRYRSHVSYLISFPFTLRALYPWPMIYLFLSSLCIYWHIYTLLCMSLNGLEYHQHTCIQSLLRVNTDEQIISLNNFNGNVEKNRTFVFSTRPLFLSFEQILMQTKYEFDTNMTYLRQW